MRVALRKLPGIESVDVSLRRASADIRLRAGNLLSLEQVRRIARENGFSAREATVTAIGRIIERDGQPALEVSGTNLVVPIAEDPAAPAAFKQAQDLVVAATASAIVQASGVVTSRADQDRLALRSLQPVR